MPICTGPGARARGRHWRERHSTPSVQGAPIAGPAFGVTVWGWGSRLTYSGTNEADPAFTRWVSYGYPGGANITRLNSVVLSAQ